MSRPGDAQPWVNFGGHFPRTDMGERFTINVGGDSMDLTEKRRKPGHTCKLHSSQAST